jgi:5-methylcytosine-specific restriction endonuclease McrA
MSFSEAVKANAFSRANSRCECHRKEHNHLFGRCGSLLVTRRMAQFHHKHAVARGGSDTLSNCEVLCRTCHEKTDSYGRHK